MVTKLDWQTGEPKYEDLYLVAVKVGDNAGYYAYSYWDKNGWRDTLPQNIIAFYPAMQFISKAKVEWPEPEASSHDTELPPTFADPDQFIDCTGA